MLEQHKPKVVHVPMNSKSQINNNQTDKEMKMVKFELKVFSTKIGLLLGFPRGENAKV